ncbi:DNA polymerase III subunit alpha [Streptomyces tanashiensis]
MVGDSKILTHHKGDSEVRIKLGADEDDGAASDRHRVKPDPHLEGDLKVLLDLCLAG